MSENAVPSSGATQSPTVTTPLLSVRRLLPMMSLAITLVLGLWLALDKSSLVYALITPPYTPDFTASGEAAIQQFGFSVASAGDINDDGFGDIVVGAANNNNAIYVYVGSENGLSATVFYSDTGLPGENLGWSVAGGGDINHDDVDDLVAGAPAANSSKGSAYLYFGSGAGLPTRGVTLTGELVGDQFGWSVAIIGDVNGDGNDDVAVGAKSHGSSAGSVYVYYGPIVAAVAPSIVLTGETPLDFFGTSIAGAGDVNGDGIDDLVVGAPQNDEGGLDAGKAYVFYGSDSGLSQANHDAVTGNANEKWGTSVHDAGDVNGDGFADVIVGSDTADPNGINLGRAAVYPGGPFGLIVTPLYTQQGEIDDDQYGFAVAGNGDLDGDGFSDFAAGAYRFDTTLSITTTDEGKAYSYSACDNGFLSPSLIFSDTGESPGDSYGHALAIVKDVNGDGLDDLVVGAYVAKNDIPIPVGKVYAYYGVEGGCRPALELTKTVTLANYPAIYTNTSVITVPTDAAILYNYTIRNTGNVTLTQHNVVDNKLGLVAQTAYTLTPGANVSVNITNMPGISVTPGVSITNVATWTGSLPIVSPSGVTTPTNRALSALAVASAQVNISGPATDQDHDGFPDNQEGSGDKDHDNIPAYLDPDETPNTNIDVNIEGLSIAAPASAFVGNPIVFTAIITAGTHVSYTWTFSDSQAFGNSTAGIEQAGPNQVVTHTFTSTGIFGVQVTAINPVDEEIATTSIVIRFQLHMPYIKTVGIAGAP